MGHSLFLLAPSLFARKGLCAIVLFHDTIEGLLTITDFTYTLLNLLNYDKWIVERQVGGQMPVSSPFSLCYNRTMCEEYSLFYLSRYTRFHYLLEICAVALSPFHLVTRCQRTLHDNTKQIHVSTIFFTKMFTVKKKYRYMVWNSWFLLDLKLQHPCLGDMFATPSYTASKHAVTALTRTFGVSAYLEIILYLKDW